MNYLCLNVVSKTAIYIVPSFVMLHTKHVHFPIIHLTCVSKLIKSPTKLSLSLPNIIYNYYFSIPTP